MRLTALDDPVSTKNAQTTNRPPNAIAVAAVREGVEPDAAVAYDDPDAAIADVLAHAAPGDVVVVKGSRVAGLERVGELLAEALT